MRLLASRKSYRRFSAQVKLTEKRRNGENCRLFLLVVDGDWMSVWVEIAARSHRLLPPQLPAYRVVAWLVVHLYEVAWTPAVVLHLVICIHTAPQWCSYRGFGRDPRPTKPPPQATGKIQEKNVKIFSGIPGLQFAASYTFVWRGPWKHHQDLLAAQPVCSYRSVLS